MSPTTQVASRSWLAAAALLAGAVAGCGSKGEDSGGSSGGGGSGVVKTGPGVTDNDDHASACSPTSRGVFAPLAQADHAGAPSCTGRSRTPRAASATARSSSSSRTTATTRRRPSCSTASSSRRRRAAAAARLADHRGAAADAQEGLDALAARGVAVVAAEQRLHHRDRRDLRHRDDQRPRLPHGARASSRRATRSATSTSRASTARTAWRAPSTFAEKHGHARSSSRRSRRPTRTCPARSARSSAPA